MGYGADATVVTVPRSTEHDSEIARRIMLNLTTPAVVDSVGSGASRIPRPISLWIDRPVAEKILIEVLSCGSVLFLQGYAFLTCCCYNSVKEFIATRKTCESLEARMPNMMRRITSLEYPPQGSYSR
jgi:hypothetical protein